ncbi:MAG: glutamyl-tRNA reductase [Candidatus Sericytochromatia bacterium]
MIATGISYKTAPVEIREKIAFNEVNLKEALKKLYSYDSILELAIVSTCNRTEFYIITNDTNTALNDLANFIEKEKEIDFDDINSYFYTYYNKFASEHLYNVTSGIDSVIIGEGEILSQVKTSFQIALENNYTGKIFNSLFKFAIETGKKVRTDTSISKKPISAGSLALKITKDCFPISENNPETSYKNKKVLFIGAGKINSIVAKNFKDAGINNGIILNRTIEKAKQLADELNFTYGSLDEISNHLNEADIIIVGVGVDDYLINKDNFNSTKNKVLIIDLSVPRNVDPNIRKNKNVVFYDNELVEKVIEINKEERLRIVEEAKIVINEEMTKFINWYNSFEVSPVISSLSNFMEEIRKNEILRTLKKNNFSDEQINAIEILTKSIVQKIAHYPVTNLKVTENKEEQLKHAESIKYLFQLDNEDIYSKYMRTDKNDIKPPLSCPFANTIIKKTSEVI